jgi:hypothetical protein
MKPATKQDEFDSVMTALGKMVSACNDLELNFQRFLVNLLQCQKIESAIIVSRERRSFQGMVGLTEELFAVYVHEASAREELKTIGTLAKKLNDERNNHVHSIWYMSLSQMTAAERLKNTKNARPIGVDAVELSTLAENFDRCSQRLSILIDRYFDSGKALGTPETEKLL